MAEYSLTYQHMDGLGTGLVQPDENAVTDFGAITGGTVLVDGTQAAVTAGGNAIKGLGYTAYSGTTTPITAASWLGNACFTGATPSPANANASDVAWYNKTVAATSATALRYGPGYPIGFNFTYNGTTFDRVGISAQGWIGFGQSAALGNGDPNNAVAVYTSYTTATAYLPLDNTAVLNNDIRRNRVVAVGVQGALAVTTAATTNLVPILYSSTNSSYPGAELRYETIGTAPNRVFVVQWLNYGAVVASTDVSTYRRMNFQIRLYETSNQVEVRFGKCYRGSTATTPTQTVTPFQTGLGGKIGGNGGTGVADFNQFMFINGSSATVPPDAFNRTATQNGVTGAILARRMGWTETNTNLSGITPQTAQNWYTQRFKQLNTLAANVGTYDTRRANQTIAYTQVASPDMTRFIWTPPACYLAVSNLTVTPSFNQATLNWSGTGNVDWAVSTGTDPNTATFTGGASGNSTVVSGLTVTTKYNAWIRTNCGGGNVSAWRPMVSFTTLPCMVTTLGSTTPITSVQFGGFVNASDATNSGVYFQNFTSVVGQVQAGNSYPITVESTSDGYSSGYYISVFFDWDQNGVFEARQDLGSHTITPVGSVSGSISVPANAPAGDCRMRVVQQAYGYVTDACSGGNDGQVEDYTIHVTTGGCQPPSGLVVSNVTARTATLAGRPARATRPMVTNGKCAAVAPLAPLHRPPAAPRPAPRPT
ncbi:MAG: GEVED domain-containing protein [Flavobacteriales bacterium]